jgi:hypothetical protein
MGFQGFQVLLDHTKSGGIGGFYGNGIGGFHALSYNVDADYDEDGRPTRLVLEDPTGTLEPVTESKRCLLQFAALSAAFFSAWRWESWNTLPYPLPGLFACSHHLGQWLPHLRVGHQ